jgi:endonuclease I
MKDLKQLFMKNHLRIWVLAVLVMSFAAVLAQGPNGSGTYYKNANGLKGEALKTALYGIISSQSKTPSYDDFLELYKQTDTRADGKVRDWYSNVTNFVHVRDKAGSYSQEGDVYNREHLVPQSWGAKKAGDITYVVPTDGYVNNRRSNLPFGEVGNVTYSSANGYSKVGSCKTQGYSGKVFEPNDEVKGDIARIYFYMTTRYEGTCQNWGNSVFTGTKYEPLAEWAYNMFVRWSQLDPIDDVEIARNNTIALNTVQGNRNPFVDYPGLEEYIWGSKKNVAFSYDNYVAPDGTVTPDNPDTPDTPDTPDIPDGPAVSGEFVLNNAFFGMTSTGTISNDTGDLTGTSNGITVTYSLGTGSNRYANDSQIRLYAGNTLTFTSGDNVMTSIEFTVAKNDGSKTLQASTGDLDGYKWTGVANSVEFSVDKGRGHLQLTNVKVIVIDNAEPVPPAIAEIQLKEGKTMAGYSYDESLDFSEVTNGKAWIAAGFIEGGRVMLCRVNIVPAEMGFIVTAETPGDKIQVPVSEEGSAYYANLLIPVLEERTIYPTQNINGTDYTFMGIGTIRDTGKTGFVKIASEQQYGPNKCLLRVPTEYLDTEARGLDELEVVFDETESLNDKIRMKNEDPAGAQIYDLMGRKLRGQVSRGLYIRQRQKVVIR